MATIFASPGYPHRLPDHPCKGATLSGTTTALTDGNGKATFTDLRIDKVGTYTLTGTADGYTSAVTSAVTITAGRAEKIAVHSGSPQTTPVGTEFAEPVVALVTDSAGNPVSGQVVQFATPSAGASGTFTANNNNQLNVTTAADGTASAAVRANNTAGSYSVQAVGTRLGERTPFATTGFALTNTPVAAAAAVRARTPVLDSTSVRPGTTATTPVSDTSSDAQTSTTTSSAPAPAEAEAPTPSTTSVISSAAIPTRTSSITSVSITAPTEVTTTPPSTTDTVTADIPPSTPLPTETPSPPGASQSSSPSSTASSADTTTINDRAGTLRAAPACGCRPGFASPAVSEHPGPDGQTGVPVGQRAAGKGTPMIARRTRAAASQYTEMSRRTCTPSGRPEVFHSAVGQ